MRVYGLTGGVASGKSTVARLFAEAGVPVLDADQLARSLTAPGGRAYDIVLKRFGTVDRAELRKRVFADPKARQDLEAILHPLIREESAKKLEELRQAGHSLVLYEAALLVEAGRHRDFDGLLVVEADPEVRIQRLMKRDGASRELAEKILAAQTSDELRRKAATRVVVNHGSLEDLRSQVAEVLRELRA